MAKQNKKFVATTLTAAMVASAVAPVAGAAFTDSIPNYAKDAVDYVTGKGIMNGLGGTTEFGAAKNITRAEVAVLIANALGLETKGKTASFADVPATHWASGAIAAVVEAGIAKGTDKGFEPTKNITRQEAAVMFANAYKELKLNEKTEVSFKDESKVATWAKGQVEVLASLGIFGGKTGGVFAPTDLITRGEVATLVHRTEVADVRLEIKEVVTTATKVASVSATNLKEVLVTFDGTVDEDTATDKANYSLKSGKAIQSVSLSEDKKTVTVTVVGTLANNKVDAISVSNVKAGSKVIDVKNVEFTAVDNKLPEVASIKSLGTKSLKVVFSEPVTDLTQNNFKLDGKAYFGKVVLGANNRSVILTPYSTTALAAGDHEVIVGGVKDFAGFVSLSSSHKFTVAEDKDAPTITEISATLETVTLTFSEDVDPETVSSSKVYWKSGDTKKTATGDFEQLADNKFKFTFSEANALPTGKVDIYVEGVKDYSGNEIAKDTKVSVTPEIDQTRPEVRKVTAVSETEIKVTFSKLVDEVSAKLEGNYIVKNKDGKVLSVKTANVDPKDSKSVIVELYSKLSVGENELTVKNVKDATKLKNTMLDYTGKVVLGDAAHPTFESVVKAATASDNTNRVVLKFSKKMDVNTLADYSNYLVRIDNKLQTLSGNIADISVSHDGTVVTITFAETINGKRVVFDDGVASSESGEVNVNILQVLGVKDLAGNLLKEFVDGDNNNTVNVEEGSTPFTLAQVDSDEAVKYKAELVDRKTVKVKFSTVINSAAKGAFTSGTSNKIADVQVNGTSTVTIKFEKDLKTDGSDLDINIDYTKLVDIAGNVGTNVGQQTEISIAKDNLLDSVAPVRVGDAVVNGETITLTFSEALVDQSAGVNELLRDDFTIVRVSDNKELAVKEGYSVALANDVDGNQTKVVITLKDTAARKADTHYKVTVNGAKYITDTSAKENAIANFSVTTKTKVDAGKTVKLEAARQAVTAAQTAKTNAEAAVTAAQTAKTNAEAAVTAAQTAKINAEAAAVTAEAAVTAAQTALIDNPSDGALQAAVVQAANELATARVTAATKATELTTAEATAATKATELTTAEATAATKATELTTAEATAATKAQELTDAQAALEELQA